MGFNNNISIIEAILFAYGEPIELKKLSEASGIDENTIAKLVDMLNDRYEATNSALRAVCLDNAYQLCTRGEYAEYIKTAIETARNVPLSNAAMEALTIVAYNQPVTKSFVENVRGIDSSSVMNKLAERGLIEESGRLDVPGKPIAYVTTKNFLRCFGISSLDELPPLHPQDEQLPLMNIDNADDEEAQTTI